MSLNVRYVLEGSMQRSGNRIRVNVQLIDAETGNHLWAERFDKPVADLFDMQDEIVSSARQCARYRNLLPPRPAERSAHRIPTRWICFPGQGLVEQGADPQSDGPSSGLFRTGLGARSENVEACRLGDVDAITDAALMSDDRERSFRGRDA